MVVYESNVFDSDVCHASAILSPIRDKYTELYLKGEEKRGRKTAGSANNIVLAFREQPFSGAKMRSLGRFDALFGVF